MFAHDYQARVEKEKGVTTTRALHNEEDGSDIDVVKLSVSLIQNHWPADQADALPDF